MLLVKMVSKHITKSHLSNQFWDTPLATCFIAVTKSYSYGHYYNEPHKEYLQPYASSAQTTPYQSVHFNEYGLKIMKTLLILACMNINVMQQSSNFKWDTHQIEITNKLLAFSSYL
jgi:hypothetical protein